MAPSGLVAANKAVEGPRASRLLSRTSCGRYQSLHDQPGSSPDGGPDVQKWRHPTKKLVGECLAGLLGGHAGGRGLDRDSNCPDPFSSSTAVAIVARKRQAGDVVVDRTVTDGGVIHGTEFGLDAIYTPGHAPDHICFFLEEERVLFTGDMILQGTTTVIVPRSGGDMVKYLESLERLRTMRRVDRIAPGHGEIIEEPREMIEEYIAHRHEREEQVMAALAEGPAKIPLLVERIYVDTPDELLDWAALQVQAHLVKLRGEGKVTGRDLKSTWKLA